MKKLAAARGWSMRQWLPSNCMQARSIYPDVPEGKLKEYITQAQLRPGNVWFKDGFSNIDCQTSSSR